MTTADDILRVLRRTRQTRDFTGEPIPEEALTEILDVARWTGSSQNRQSWRFVVVRDPERLPAIGTDASGERKPGIGHVAKAGAAIAIVMTTDQPTWETFDEARVAERMLVAATALGLGAAIGWVRDHQQAEVRAILGLPEDRVLRTIVSVGVPTEAGALPKTGPPGPVANRPARAAPRGPTHSRRGAAPTSALRCGAHERATVRTAHVGRFPPRRTFLSDATVGGVTGSSMVVGALGPVA